MAVIIDTSVVLGWLERKTPSTVAAITAIGTTPLIHVVSLGEIQDGVARSELAGADDTALRRLTLDFATTRLRRPEPSREMASECFGWVSAATSRKLSHNDKWIVAASIVGGHRVLTEDHRLHDTVVDNTVLNDACARNGWAPPDIVLVGPARTAP